jgi:hypothetical protein
MLNEAVAVFNKYLDDEKIKHGDVQWRTGGRASKAWPNGEDESWWRIEGPKQIETYVAWREANPNLVVWDHAGVPAIEMNVSAIVGDITVKGFIDRVFVDVETGELLIVDLKTGKNTPHSPLQLAFYRLLLEKTVGITATFGAYWMSRSGTLSTVHNLDRYSEDMLYRWLSNVKKSIELGLFTPHVGMMCGSCGVREYCYAVNPEVKPFFSTHSNPTVLELA